jgi:hypothetical protein
LHDKQRTRFWCVEEESRMDFQIPAFAQGSYRPSQNEKKAPSLAGKLPDDPILVMSATNCSPSALVAMFLQMHMQPLNPWRTNPKRFL